MTPPESSNASNGRLVPVVIVVVALVGLVILFTSLTVLTTPHELPDALRLALPLWIPWCLFAPLAVFLAFRFPIERERWIRSLAIHGLAAAATVLTNQAVTRDLAGNGAGGGPPPWAPRSLGEGGPPPPGPRRAEPGGPRRPRGGPPVARMALDVLIYGLLVSICQTVAWSHRARERERRALTAEARLAQARLAALQMQLNPHFLFNALNTVATLIHTHPRAADDMLANLGQLLRLSLDSADEQEVPLRRELEFLRRYLDVEQCRFGDRLHVEQQFEPDTLTAFVPTLLLQPLVENAIRHGMEPRATPCRILLRARREGDRLLLEVRDDGAGLRDTPVRGEGAARTGIGLANTRSRLQALYGDQQLLRLRNAEGGGCLVEIELPFHTEPVAGELSP